MRRIPIHETFRIGALLAVVGGFLDAYTYLLKGGVFANAQTGNIVLLAVNMADGRYHQALYFIMPILAFVAGVFVTELIKAKTSRIFFMEWEHIVILIEIILLVCIGFLPENVPHEFVNITISFICSMQVNSFRKMHSITYASTMCTGNLRSGTESLFRCLAGKDLDAGQSTVHYFGIILFFIAGAAGGTLLAGVWGEKSIWVCCLFLAAALSGMLLSRNVKEEI